MFETLIIGIVIAEDTRLLKWKKLWNTRAWWENANTFQVVIMYEGEEEAGSWAEAWQTCGGGECLFHGKWDSFGTSEGIV